MGEPLFSGPAPRLAAGLLIGGTAGVLLASLFYSREWAPRPGLSERQQLMAMLLHLMVGLVYGMSMGSLLTMAVRRRGAWIGALFFGVLGVYAAPVLGGLVAGPESQDPVRIAVAAAFPALGAILGRWIIG